MLSYDGCVSLKPAQVLDARDPLGCRSARVEQAVLESGGRKKLVLVLNKIDLVPREVVEAWLKHLRNEFPTVAFKASTQVRHFIYICVYGTCVSEVLCGVNYY